MLYFSRKDTENKVDEIYLFDAINQSTTRLTHINRNNFCPAWHPSGNKIAFATSMQDSRPEMFILDWSGNTMERITYNKFGDTEPCWSPDGKRMLISAYRNDNYEIVELVLEP